MSNRVIKAPGLDDGGGADYIDSFGQVIDEKTTTVEGFLKALAEDFYSYKALDGLQEFQAQIYSVERVLVEEQDDRLYSNERKFTPNKTYYKCRARISRIHDSLPIPSSFGNTEADKGTIELYEPPVISEFPVSVGDFVVVKFENLKAKTDCKVIKRLNETSDGQGSVKPAGASAPSEDIKKGFSNKGAAPKTIGNSGT